MSAHVEFPRRNALLAAGEYLAQPLALLAVTPVLLRQLGAAHFSIYLLVSTVVSASTLLSSGFGDAAIRHHHGVEAASGASGLERLMRTAITLNALLGLMASATIAISAPWFIHILRNLSPSDAKLCVTCVRVGAALAMLRSAELATVACLRSFERYDLSVPVSVTGKVAAPLLACVMVLHSAELPRIIAVHVGLSITTLAVQITMLGRHFHARSVRPMLDRSTLRLITGFGISGWLQALVGVVTQQGDRLVVGALLGAPAFAAYSVCTQLAAPIHGITAAGLQALYPRLSRILAYGSRESFTSTVRRGLVVNAVAVCALTVPLLLLPGLLLQHFLGPQLAVSAVIPLRLSAIAAALLALNVTGYWALLGLGRINLLVALNLAGAAAFIVGVILFTPAYGMLGAAAARLCIGPITWLSYAWLRKSLAVEEPRQTALMEAA